MEARLPEFLGRYQVVGEIGTGGMAEILLARLTGPSGFERPVVLKRILPHLARRESFVTMFLDEARIVAQIRHNNVVQVQELVHEGNELYMVMEYLEGESVAGLTKRLARQGERLDHALGAYVISEACAGLHAAHELVDGSGAPQNVVHRDISPQNLFVTYGGQVKVLDFGIAKAADRLAHTQTGLLKGKLAYMSPEQCGHGAVDRRSDVFSLGVVLFELTTGRLLFQRRNEVETLHAITSEPIIPPSRVLPDYPRALEAVCLRALARAADERYATADEMRRELRAVVRELRREDDAGEALATTMRHLFADRAVEKQSMLQRLRGGSAPSAVPAGDPDASLDLPTSVATTAERPRTSAPVITKRRVTIATSALILAAAAVAVVVWRGLRTVPPSPGPVAAVVVSNLRALWTTPNSIQWEWTVSDASPDQLASYELVVGPEESDVTGRTPRAEIWDARRNPELGRYLLLNTPGVTKVSSTITFGHAPATDHWGQLVAIDQAGRRSFTAVVRARTGIAVDQITLVPDAPCASGCTTLPTWYERSTQGANEGAACHRAFICCDAEPVPDKRVCDRVSSCYENLRIQHLPAQLGRLTAGAFASSAFLEFAVAHRSPVQSAWSQTWLTIGDFDCGFKCIFIYQGFTFPPDGTYRTFQIPLRHLRNRYGLLLSFEEMRARKFTVAEFAVGGNWTAGAEVRVDSIRVRW